MPHDVADLFGKRKIEESLKTSDLIAARIARNKRISQLEKEWSILRDGSERMRADNFSSSARAERQAFENEELEVMPLLDGLVDELDGIAIKFATQAKNPEDLDELRDMAVREDKRAAEIHKLIETYNGHLSYTQAGREWLERNKDELSKSTLNEYRKAFELADAHGLPSIKRLDKPALQGWANTLGGTYAKASIKKMLGAIRGLLKYNAIETSKLGDILVTSVVQKTERQIWTEDDIKLVLRSAVQDWLRDAIQIALYTGAREGAIAAIKYDAKRDMLTIPAQKKEAAAREVPCHPHIKEAVQRWIEKPKAKSSISNRFTEAKKAAGFEADGALVFHSLRHTTLSKMNDLGIPEEAAARIVGHKVSTMSYGLYGNKGDAEALRTHINKLDWSDVFSD